MNAPSVSVRGGTRRRPVAQQNGTGNKTFVDANRIASGRASRSAGSVSVSGNAVKRTGAQLRQTQAGKKKMAQAARTRRAAQKDAIVTMIEIMGKLATETVSESPSESPSVSVSVSVSVTATATATVTTTTTARVAETAHESHGTVRMQGKMETAAMRVTLAGTRAGRLRLMAATNVGRIQWTREGEEKVQHI
jgi:hypothetical protein